MTDQIQLLKLREVTRITSLSRPTIYRLMARGKFPSQLNLSPRRVAWRADEITAWIGSQPHR